MTARFEVKHDVFSLMPFKWLPVAGVIKDGYGSAPLRAFAATHAYLF